MEAVVRALAPPAAPRRRTLAGVFAAGLLVLMGSLYLVRSRLPCAFLWELRRFLTGSCRLPQYLKRQVVERGQSDKCSRWKIGFSYPAGQKLKTATLPF